MKSSIIPLLIFSSFALMAQAPEFYEHYSQYRQEGLDKRRFSHRDIQPMLLELKEHPDFTLTKAGESVQGRPIYLVKVGHGKTKVLLWSQMHGDESTATMALMDVFNFFKAPQQLDSIRQQLLSELSIWFVPMLNPDGAAVFQRRNASGIDVNRDALRLSSPEARILKSLQDSLRPDWAFNLHDQNTLNAAGKGGKPATISFLAPPYDEEGSRNRVRERAMKLIVELNNVLQAFIPAQVGRFSADYERRAFGDDFQRSGSSTILIESGGYHNDPEKQYIRKLNFSILLHALLSIASGTYQQQELEAYEKIPQNHWHLYHLIIRNALVKEHGQWFEMDIAIKRDEKEVAGRQDYYYKSFIEDMGDLEGFHGYEELDAQGLQAVPGKVYEQTFEDMEALKQADLHQLIKAGYTSVKLKKLPEDRYTSFPLNIIPEHSGQQAALLYGAQPNFVLRKEGEVRYAIINGFVYDVEKEENKVKNALVGEQ